MRFANSFGLEASRLELAIHTILLRAPLDTHQTAHMFQHRAFARDLSGSYRRFVIGLADCAWSSSSHSAMRLRIKSLSAVKSVSLRSTRAVGQSERAVSQMSEERLESSAEREVEARADASEWAFAAAAERCVSARADERAEAAGAHDSGAGSVGCSRRHGLSEPRAVVVSIVPATRAVRGARSSPAEDSALPDSSSRASTTRETRRSELQFRDLKKINKKKTPTSLSREREPNAPLDSRRNDACDATHGWEGGLKDEAPPLARRGVGVGACTQVTMICV